MSFEKLNVRPETITALKEMGIEAPTKIQSEAIPLIKAGEDVIGMSNTGSGKTAAFGIPIIERIVPRAGVQVLIMAPIRELAAQIAEELKKFGKYQRFRVTTIFGGVGFGPQIRNMSEADIIVGTPGRLLDHLEKGNLNLSSINCIVLDEADKMVEMGFIEDVERIIQAMPDKKQVLLFGATISDEIEKIKNRYMHDPKVAKADKLVKQEFLSQYYYDIEAHEKFSLLVHLLRQEDIGRAIVFCEKRNTVDILMRNLRSQGISVEMIHGKLNQNRRLKVINDFKNGKPKILVASSVAARGIDIRDLTHVFNYELSRDPQEYIHRVGRTARAGDKGRAITLLSRQDHDTFNSILGYYDVSVEILPNGEFPRLKFDAGRRDSGRRNFRGPPRGFNGNRGGRFSGRSNRSSGSEDNSARPAWNRNSSRSNSSRPAWNKKPVWNH
ncbi:MAG: DEAD/DEAH box helicase [archaeon]